MSTDDKVQTWAFNRLSEQQNIKLEIERTKDKLKNAKNLAKYHNNKVRDLSIKLKELKGRK